MLGTVESVRSTDPPQEFEGSPWLVSTVSVEEYLKGSGPPTLQHTFPGDIASCTSGDREGHRYLLSYVRQSDGTLGTNFCSGSLDLTDAGEEVADQQVQEVRDLLRDSIVTEFPKSGSGTGLADNSFGWQVTAAAAGALLAVSASAALVTLRRRVS